MTSDLRNELESVVFKIAYCCDHEEGRGAAAFFTEDAVMEVPGVSVIRGREEIDRIHRRREGTPFTQRHIYTSFLVLEHTADRARATNMVLGFFAAGSGPHAATTPVMADIFYDFVREPDGAWRIGKREIHFTFGGAANPGKAYVRETSHGQEHS